MPDHIHFFCSPAKADYPDLRSWMKYWKSTVSRRWPYKSEQPIWQTDAWDTQLRSANNYNAKWEYVRQNPVRAGLVEQAGDWPFQGELNVLFW